MNKKELLIKYREEHGWEMPSLKLARIIYKENPLNWSTEDAIRKGLRDLEGKGGRIKQPFKTIPERPKNPYNLPESFETEKLIYQVAKDIRKILYLPDLHIPYHNIKWCSKAMDKGVKEGVNMVILPGDVLDMHNGSKYQSDPRKRSMKQEFDAGREFLEQLRIAFPTQQIIWLKGNHCTRMEKFLLSKVKEIWDDPYFHLEERLQLNDLKIKILDDKITIKAGNLNITHGHYIINSPWGSVNPAKTLFDKTGVDFLIAHVHKPFTYQKPNAEGKIIKCYTMGCLSERYPDYNPIVSNYLNGFGYQELDPSGEYEFQNISQ